MQTTTHPIEIRNLRFNLETDVPKHWHDGGRGVTLFFDNLSTLFPEGERFFIASIRAHLSEVTDPELRAAVRLFCGQEAMHGREHERMNAMIDAHGYPAAELDARLKVLLGAVQKTFPKRWQLAATCALEHYTALLGDLILSNPEILADAHPEMRRLWNWHAAEESEHKAVAFDVYQAAGGNAPERGFVMVVATVIFWAVLFDQQVRLMHADGIATSPKEWVKLGRFMFGKPARLQRLTAPLLDFFRPSFHPWDHDNSSVLEAWRHGHTAAAA